MFFLVLFIATNMRLFSQEASYDIYKCCNNDSVFKPTPEEKEMMNKWGLFDKPNTNDLMIAMKQKQVIPFHVSGMYKLAQAGTINLLQPPKIAIEGLNDLMLSASCGFCPSIRALSVWILANKASIGFYYMYTKLIYDLGHTELEDHINEIRALILETEGSERLNYHDSFVADRLAKIEVNKKFRLNSDGTIKLYVVNMDEIDLLINLVRSPHIEKKS